jgi:histidinol-phosphate/aromatic aminotransferase/cobyric acid decarboxylase-like protein
LDPKSGEAVKQNAADTVYLTRTRKLRANAKYVGTASSENILGNGSIELIYMITEILPRGQRPNSSAVILRIREATLG